MIQAGLRYRLKSGTVGTPGTVGTVVTLGRVGTEVTLGTVGAGVTLGTVGTVKTKHSEQLDYVINGVPEVSGLNRNLKRTINSLTMLHSERTVGAGVTLGTVGTVKTKHSEQLDYGINGVPEVSGLNRNLKRTINSLTMLFRVFRGRAFWIFEAIHANIH